MCDLRRRLGGTLTSPSGARGERETIGDESDFELHRLVERRPLIALEVLVEMVDELSELLAQLERRTRTLEDSDELT